MSSALGLVWQHLDWPWFLNPQFTLFGICLQYFCLGMALMVMVFPSFLLVRGLSINFIQVVGLNFYCLALSLSFLF